MLLPVYATGILLWFVNANHFANISILLIITSGHCMASWNASTYLQVDCQCGIRRD